MDRVMLWRIPMKWKAAGIPLTVLLFFCLLAPVDAGDRDVAELLFTKGEKALKKRSYGEAADYFQRALDESSPYPEAAFALAQALEKQGKGPEALKAYLRCKDECEALEKPTRKQKKMCGKAEKAIGKLGQGYASLEKLDAKFVKDCLAFGRKYKKSAPPWAKKALESAHEIAPSNSGVVSALDRLGDVTGPSSGDGGLYDPLIKDDSLTGWDPGIGKGFICRDRVIISTTPIDSGVSNIIRMRLEGSWSLKGSFRVLLQSGRKISHGIIFARKPDGSSWGVIIDWDKSLSLVRWAADGKAQTYSFKKIPSYHAERWHQIRVDVEGGKITAFFNGDRFLAHEEADPEAFAGMPSIFTQRGKFEIKDLGVKR